MARIMVVEDDAQMCALIAEVLAVDGHETVQVSEGGAALVLATQGQVDAAVIDVTVACVLRGAPGVSVVGGGNGAQIGVPASRDQSGARDVTLAAHGGQAHAPLTILDLFHGSFAPTGCNVVAGKGYRVYPPHSTRAYYLPQNEIYACSGTPVFLHVGVVSIGAK